SPEILIEQDDFKEDANRKFFRLKPGGEVRLRGSYIVKCETVEKDADGNITALTGTIDKDTLGKNPEDRKVKGVIHWVSAPHATTAEVHLIDRLFATEDMTKAEGDFIDHLNPDSLTVIPKAHLEPSLATAEPGTPVQFERLGYFIPDKTENTWLRTIGLRDTWAKVAKK
ncbi:glutamine--tRNA ligase, partial [Verrucomicrobiales bacterium]|nr:glutamine--tRNA ligase [Verrucomicrobiales bacterium]